MNTVSRQQYNQLFSGLLLAIGNIVSQLFLTLLIFVFMLYTALSFPSTANLGISMESGLVPQIIGLTGDVRRYITLTALINLMVGIGDAILLWLTGVPYVLLWGTMAWVLGFIPAVGYWIALIPPVLLAYSLYGTRTALIVFIGYAIINGTAANIISPRLLGKGLSISPLIVFISVFIWGWLLGAIGAILAIPLTMLIITILRNFSATDWLARLMSYVPGSEDKTNTEAINRVKGFLGRISQHLPSPKPNEPPPAVGVDETIRPAPDGERDLSH
jgi:predicted PurR-regulated permease PerM